MKTDYQTKQGRLQKQYPLRHFRPELENVEIFGAEIENQIPVSIFEKIMYNILAFLAGILIYQLIKNIWF